MKYQYTLLKQDNTTEDLGVHDEPLNFKDLREILNCSLIEVIHSDYYKEENVDGIVCYGDEEGRYNEENKTNPHFHVLAPGWDVVGNVVKEVRV